MRKGGGAADRGGRGHTISPLGRGGGGGRCVTGRKGGARNGAERTRK